MQRIEPGASLPKGVPRPILSGDGDLISNQVIADAAIRITLSSDAFDDGRPIPKRYSAEGENASPPLSWEEIPIQAKEFLIVCEDPDAPHYEPFVHWVLGNISPNVSELNEGVPHVRRPSFPVGAMQCRNSRGDLGYMGPLPPHGDGIHHYHFQIFAVDKILLLPEHLERERLIDMIRQHVVGIGELVGTYERR